MEIINIHKAKTNLSALIERVLKGEKIIIARNGKPLVRLEKIKHEAGRRIPGKLRGKIKMTDDFDVLPDEFMKYFQ
jgi:prevent-host-death family protein